MALQQWMVAGALAASAATSAFAGPEWVEDGDAGRLPGTAQRTSGEGAVTSILGKLEGLEADPARGLLPDDFEDLYIIQIDDPCEFFVGVDPCFDARLFLFTLDGTGVIGSDEAYIFSRGNGGKYQVELFGCEILPGPGEYILAIVADSREPVSELGDIFDLPSMGQTTANGPGAESPLIDWTGDVTSPFGCGDYELIIEGADLVPPANNECFDAEPIGLVTDQPFSTVGADGGPMPCGLGGNDIWYVFTSPATGIVQVDLCGSLFDTVLAVYDGDSCDPLPALIECNDDADCPGEEERGGSLQSLIQFPATAGQSYLIQVGGFFSASGDGDITIKFLASPCDLPGRPDPEGSGDRVIRGYILAWAVDQNNQEIRWNHLSGSATIVDYRGTAAEYGAMAYPVLPSAASHGQQSGTPGILNLDGNEYAATYDELLFNFVAPSGPLMTDIGVETRAWTDLTLHVLDADLTMNTAGPTRTKVAANVWNMNETKFSNTRRCITCWDEVPLSQFADNALVPNNFLLSNLQTSVGKARLSGVAADECPESVAAALLGVATKRILPTTNRGIVIARDGAASAMNLVGMGERAATISYDVLAPPDEIADGKRPRRPATRPQSARAAGAGGAVARGSVFEKGSLIVFSKVEVRFDEFGDVVQDTFIQLTNDYAEDVRVQMMFVNGDDPMTEFTPNDICEHPGWNWVDNEILLTGNQTLYWSAASGFPAGVSPWTILDP